MAQPNWKVKTPRDEGYKEFIRGKPCLLGTGKHGPCLGDVASHHTETGGMSLKGSDYSCIPLCVIHHRVMDNAGKQGREIWANGELDAAIQKYNAEWLAPGNNFDQGNSKPKPKRRVRPAKGRPMAKKKAETEIEVACAICQHPHGTFVKKTIPKAFVCGSCGIGQKVEKADWVSHTHKRNYPEGALN